MPSEADLRAAAVACFGNARELCEEAELLAERGRHARATALALIGAEEFGKAVVYTVAALLPAQRHLLPLRLDGHELKHQVCASAEGAQIVNEQAWDITSEYPSTPESRFTDMFATLAEWGLADLLDEKSAKRYYKERRLKDEQERREWGHLQADPEKDIYLPLREPDLKNAALYVDLDADGQVLSPEARVDARCAERSIGSLRWFLEQYALLGSMVGEAKAWARLAAEARRGLPGDA